MKDALDIDAIERRLHEGEPHMADIERALQELRDEKRRHLDHVARLRKAMREIEEQLRQLSFNGD